MGKTKDSNMRAKIAKVRKYDVIARRERLAMDTIQDARQRARNSKPVDKYELIYDDGHTERFTSYAAMRARFDVSSGHVIHKLDLIERPYNIKSKEPEVYIVTLCDGSIRHYYDEADALERALRKDVDSILYLPSCKRLSRDSLLMMLL